MNNNILYYTLFIGITIYGIIKNSLQFNPIQFQCDNYVLNTYLYFILSWAIIMATTASIKNTNIPLNQLFTGPFTILLIVSSISLLVGLLFISPRYFFTKHILYISLMVLLGITLYPYFQHNKTLFYHIATTTLIILIMLSLVVYFIPQIVSESWFSYLFIGLTGVLIARIVELLMVYKNKQVPVFSKWTSYISILLFSLFIMYDTKKVLVNAENCINPDYINETINLVLDSLHLFTNLYRVNRK